MKAPVKSKQLSRRPAKVARKGKRIALNRRAWIEAARSELVVGGIAAVKIGALASNLAVTREAFYWHFKSLEELKDELLTDWERGNADAYTSLLKSDYDAEQAFQAMDKMWIEEAPYSPAWDSAMRDWARTSEKAQRVVKRIDEQRIELIKKLYLQMGYDAIESLVRARILYFHQVGYYTIALKESREERVKLLSVYLRILRDRP